MDSHHLSHHVISDDSFVASHNPGTFYPISSSFKRYLGLRLVLRKQTWHSTISSNCYHCRIVQRKIREEGAGLQTHHLLLYFIHGTVLLEFAGSSVHVDPRVLAIYARVLFARGTHKAYKVVSKLMQERVKESEWQDRSDTDYHWSLFCLCVSVNWLDCAIQRQQCPDKLLW